MEITNLKKKQKITLSLKNKKILQIPKHNWVRLSFAKKDSIILILCDYNYEKNIFNLKKSFLRNKK